MAPLLKTMRHLVDRLRRRFAYVPAVSQTVKSLQDIGVELTDQK